MFLHFDSIGLFYLGNSNESRLNFFNEILNKVAEGGGNVILPAFSYSFCRDEIFDINDSSTTLGASHEYIRSRNSSRRTSDGVFSYLIFGTLPIFKEYMHQRLRNDCFGESSLLNKVLQADGWISSIGGVIQSTTEIHHVEKKLDVQYRFDKKFSGTIVNKDNSYQQESIFFCRDLNFYKKTLLGSDLTNLYKDLSSKKKMKEININNDFLLDYVSYGDIYDTTKEEISKNPYYLLSQRNDMFSG